MKRPLSQRSVKVVLGRAELAVGTLGFSKDGARESSTFAYREDWLKSTDRFEISPDLPLVEGNQFRKPPSRDGAVVSRRAGGFAHLAM